jgi:mxaC protein
MAAAMAEINRQQSVLTSFIERLPREDCSAYCFAAALLGCGLLLVLRFVQVRGWR